jgi:hypothetical protein
MIYLDEIMKRKKPNVIVYIYISFHFLENRTTKHKMMNNLKLNIVFHIPSHNETRGVSQYGLAIYIKKKYLKGKRRIMMKTQIYFTMQKKYNLQKNPPKETKILQDIITL